MAKKQNLSSKKERTTTLETIRKFLHDEGIYASAGNGRSDAVRDLYRLLKSRHDDERFWKDLRNLGAQLDDPRFNPNALLRSGAFDDVTAEILLQDLRTELGGQRDDNQPFWKRIGSKIGATGLTAFLLLGSASACGNSCESDARDLGLKGEDVEVYCGLSSVVLDADVPWTVKSNILDCLPELDSYYRENLLEQFQSSSDEELADLLKTISTDEPCDEFDFGYDSGH